MIAYILHNFNGFTNLWTLFNYLVYCISDRAGGVINPRPLTPHVCTVRYTAVSKVNVKTILSAFGLDENSIRKEAAEISMTASDLWLLSSPQRLSGLTCG